MSKYKIDNFKQDLLQSNTFKKDMNRSKIWGLISIIVIIIAAIVIGGLGEKLNDDDNKDVLTLKTIVKTFKNQGLYLKEDKSKSVDNFDLNGIKPTIYCIGNNKDNILIYTFKSFNERREILSKTNKYNNPYSLEEVPYYAKNVLIVFMPSEIPRTEEDFASIVKTSRLISNTVFKYLNDGKERIYKGESTNWEGTFTLKYYEHWIEDEGKLYYDSYSTQYPEIKYKMSDIENVGTITLGYETTHSKSEYTGLNLNKEGNINLGSSGGSGLILNEKDEIKYTIKWKGKEEYIILKAGTEQ